MVEIEKIKKLKDNIEKVFMGKPEVVKLLITGLLAQGHLLIEDVPGVGKTILARVLAKSIDCSFRRIQFTPDLLPSDIVGVSIYSQDCGEFIFKRGPVFTNVVLADEINRTTPRTQSSLLEAMNDFQVSLDGKTHMLDMPFIVLATQNPYEFEGTYPLPESQLDRFLMRLEIGYPSFEDEKRVLFSQTVEHPITQISPVLSKKDIISLQESVKKIHIEESLIKYVLDIARKSRENNRIEVGVSPRGSLMFRRAVQAHALVSGRDYVIPDDIKNLASAVLSHRIVLRATSRQDIKKAILLIKEIVDSIPVPV
ncbi:MAG: MoxR family ATPase [Planctomycetota bacterium]